jgi:hypothetical protein
MLVTAEEFVSRGTTMVETFYKTEVDVEKFAESAEYYTLALIHLTGSFFIVTEHYGWWDNVVNKARLKTTTLTTVGEPTAEVEARRIYDEQRTYLVGQGFVHIYQRDAMNGRPAQEALGAVKEWKQTYGVDV